MPPEDNEAIVDAWLELTGVMLIFFTGDPDPDRARARVMDARKVMHEAIDDFPPSVLEAQPQTRKALMLEDSKRAKEFIDKFITAIGE